MYAGYVLQQHNVRNNSSGMTQGWSEYGNKIEPAVRTNIVSELSDHDQVVEWNDDNYDLGKIPNLHSLIPYSQKAKKPVFHCRSADGLRGEHITKARNTRDYFEPICQAIRTLDSSA